MDAVTVVLLVLAGSGLMVICCMHRIYTIRYRVAFGLLAPQHGGQITTSMVALPSWSLEIDGATAQISALPGGALSGGGGRLPSTFINVQMEMAVPERLCGALYPQKGLRFLARLSKDPDVTTGDAGFDERFVVRGDDATGMRELLDAELRQQLMKRPGLVRVIISSGSFSVAILELTHKRADLEWLIETAHVLRRRLQPDV